MTINLVEFIQEQALQYIHLLAAMFFELSLAVKPAGASLIN